MGVRFYGNVQLPTIIIGKGRGRFATIYLLSANEDGTFFRQSISNGSITWSDTLTEASIPVAIDGNAYTNYSYIAYQNKFVKKFDIRGTELWSNTLTYIPTDLALGSNNKVYVVQNSNTISVFDTDTGEKETDITIENVSKVAAKYGLHVGTTNGYVHYVDQDGVIQSSYNTGSSVIDLQNNKDGSVISLSSNKISRISNTSNLVWSYNDTSYGTFKSFTYDPFDKFTYVGTTSGNIIKINDSGQYINHFNVSSNPMNAISFWYDTLYVADSNGNVSAYDESFVEKWYREGSSIAKVDLHVTQSQESIHPPIKTINKGSLSNVVVSPQVNESYSVLVSDYTETDYANTLLPTEFDVSKGIAVTTKPLSNEAYEVVSNYSDQTSVYNDTLLRTEFDISKDIVVVTKPLSNESYEVVANYTDNTQTYNDTLISPMVDINTSSSFNTKPVINRSYELNINYTGE